VEAGSPVEILRDFPRLSLKTGERGSFIKILGQGIYEIIMPTKFDPKDRNPSSSTLIAVEKEWIKEIPQD